MLFFPIACEQRASGASTTSDPTAACESLQCLSRQLIDLHLVPQAAPGYVDSMRLEAERSSEEPEASDGSISPDSENDGASAMVETHDQVRPRIMRKALSETNVGNLQAEAEGEGYDMI